MVRPVDSLRQIGYVKAPRAERMAEQLDTGDMRVTRAYVRSFYAPPVYAPRVSLVIEAVVSKPAAGMRPRSGRRG